MSTHPLMHASSPAVVKVNNTTRTVATPAFNPPARIALVAGITSDADVTTTAAPTIAAIAGLTWTRVGPNLGFGSGGDVGLVALFAGVLDDPDTDLGSITVTVDTNITVSKPKMLIVRVYDETQVDISDPIGAIASGSFAASTSWFADLVPETSEGGVRGLALDWSATGIPTVLRPNIDNTELVDAFHNAGLSTNVQISGEKRTRAGIPHTIGANLLASAADGNWLVYELRGPQPAAGPAFDAGAFSSPAFATIGGGGTTTNSTTSESTTTADSAARTLSQPRTAAESTSTADASTRTVARARAAAETTTASDAASRTLARARAAAETTATADVTAGAITRVLARSCSETTSTSDTAARAHAQVRAAAESTTTADQAARTRSQPRTATESTSTADASTRTVARARSAAETTTTSDSTTPSTTGQIVRSTSETTTTADQAATTRSQPRTATESTSTADASTRTVARSRTASEATSTSDSNAGARTGAPRIRSTAETTTTSDTTQGSTTGQIVRGTSESTTSSDQVARRTSRARAAAETTSTSDSNARRTTRGRLQLETTTLDDLAARAIATSRQQLETTTTVDTCSPLMGLPPFEIEILRVVGRQRQVITAGRSGRSFTSTGRPPETPPAGRARTFSWTGRPRPPITGSP